MAESRLVASRTDASGMLTTQETRVMELLLEGKRDKEISRLLIISSASVTNAVERACKKMNVRTRLQAAVAFDRMRAAWP